MTSNGSQEVSGKDAEYVEALRESLGVFRGERRLREVIDRFLDHLHALAAPGREEEYYAYLDQGEREIEEFTAQHRAEFGGFFDADPAPSSALEERDKDLHSIAASLDERVYADLISHTVDRDAREEVEA